MLNMCQISSLTAAAEGPVAEFSSFANFEEKKRKSNLLMSFPKIGNQIGSFGQIRKKSFFRFCRPILDIFGFTLLRACPCKNRPLKFSWKMDCLHFSYTSRATYAMNENGLYFDRFAFLIFWGIFFVATPTTQTGNWNPKNWGLRHACSNFAHSMKQPNSFRITA